MESIKLFLGKFKDYVPPEILAKKLIQEVIERQIGLKLKSEEIQLSGPAVYFRTSPAAKSEIMIKQEAIMRELESALTGLRRTPKKLI